MDFLSSYEEAGTLPDDLVDIDDEISRVYFDSLPPEGKMRVAGDDGLPAWGDIPPQPNSILLSNAISILAAQYKSDIAELNVLYLAAIVNDGPNELSKQQYVRDQISARKIKYNADIADARAKYPL